MLRVILAVLLLAVPAMTGCVLEGDPPKSYRERDYARVVPSGVTPENRTDQDVYIVLLRGTEAWEIITERSPDDRTVCPDSESFAVDEARQRVRYDRDRYTLDSHPAVVILIDYEGVRITPDGLRSGCPTVQKMLSFPSRANFNITLRHDLTLNVVVESQNGAVAVNRNYFARMGEKVQGGIGRIDHSDKTDYWVAGTWEVVNVGAWPRSNITKG